MENTKNSQNKLESHFSFYKNLFIFYNKNTNGFFLKSFLIIVFTSLVAATFSLFQEDVKSFLGTVLYGKIILNRVFLEKNMHIFLGVLVTVFSLFFSALYYFLVKIKYMKIEYQKNVTAAYSILLLNFSRGYTFRKVPDQEISEKLEMYNSRARSGVVETFSLLLEIPKSLCTLLLLLLFLQAFTTAPAALIFFSALFCFYFRVKLDNESRGSHTEQSINRIMIQNSVSIFSQPANMRAFESVKIFSFFIQKLKISQNLLRDFANSFLQKRSKTMAVSMFLDCLIMFFVLIYFISKSKYSDIFEKDNFLKTLSFCMFYFFSYIKLIKTRALICDFLQKIADAKIAKKIFKENQNRFNGVKAFKNQQIYLKEVLYKEESVHIPIFKGLNFTAKSGVNYGLYFPAMSGATLFAKIISGQKSPSSGLVKIPGKLIYFPPGNIFPPGLSVFEKIFEENLLLAFKDSELINKVLELSCLSEKIFSKLKITSSEKILIRYARLIYLISKAEKNQFIVVDYDQDGLSDGLYKKVMESIVTLCKDKTHTLVVIHSNRNIQEFFDKRLEVMDGKLIEDKNF